MLNFGFGPQLDSSEDPLGWRGVGKCLKGFGGPGRVRTDDLCHAMEARSQLRLFFGREERFVPCSYHGAPERSDIR